MNTITRRLVIVSSLMALAFVASPALAICKYGSPHCVNPHPGPKAPTVNTNRLPDGPPGNDDCKYYGNCDDGSPEGTGPDGNPNGGLGNGGSPAVIVIHPGHLHPQPGILLRHR
jgi:hypothetical protein